jgi:anti-sigma factor RsiW
MISKQRSAPNSARIKSKRPTKHPNRQVMQAYAHKQLSAKKALQFSQHVAQCPRCQAALAEIQYQVGQTASTVAQSVAGLAAEAPNLAAYLPTILAEVRGESKPKRRPQMAQFIAVGFKMSFALTFALFFMGAVVSSALAHEGQRPLPMPAVPMDIAATATPYITRPPWGAPTISALLPHPSEVFVAPTTLPRPSPAPRALNN